MYTSPSFDTHKFVKSFTVVGMKEEQAEAIVTAIVESRDHDLSKLATKDQLEAVKAQIETVRVQLDSKIDNSISKLEASLLKWFIATALAMTGIIIAAIKFIH
jgi:hypothetical protein